MWYSNGPSILTPFSFPLFAFAGLVAVVCMYQMKRFEKHRTWIFYFTPAMYLLYMAYEGFRFAYSNQSYNDFFGPASWVFV